MRVFVAGANGAVGRRLVPMLVARGHQVTGTTTNEKSVNAIRAMGAVPVVVDGLDAIAVGEAVARAEPDAIIHQMTALSAAPDFRHFDRWFAPTNRLRTEGTQNLLAAAKATGVKRFVAQSFTGWSNARDGNLDQDRGRPARSAPGQGADRDARGDQVPGAGGDRSAARRDRRPLRRSLRAGLLGDARRNPPQANVPGHRRRGRAYVSSTHIDDAAGGTLAALERGQRGIYNIVDDEPAPTREFIPAIAEALGAPKPLRIPAWLGRLLAGDVAVTMMTEGRGSSNAKAKRELGWQPIWPSWRDGYRHGLDTPVPLPPRAKETTAA